MSRIANKIHLSPELIARVATYAEAANSPELWNICLAVGPATSRIIRHYYLKQNHHFLTRCIRFFCSQKITNVKLRDYYLVWMTVNNDWKAYVNKTYTEFTKFSCVRQGDKAVNKIHPYAAFNNPAVAIQIGLMEPLRYLVEKKAIHTNSFEWTPFHSSVPRHLLYWSMLFAPKTDGTRVEIFRYLLLNSDCRLRRRQDMILRISHTGSCPFEKDQCPVPANCSYWKGLVRHIVSCKKKNSFPVPNCTTGRHLIRHHYLCKDKGCEICKPLRRVIQKHQTMASSAATDASGGSDKNKMKIKVEFFVEALANLRNKPLQNIRCRLHPKETSKPLFNALFKFHPFVRKLVINHFLSSIFSCSTQILISMAGLLRLKINLSRLFRRYALKSSKAYEN